MILQETKVNMRNKNKNLFWIIGITVLALGLYNIILFTIPTLFTGDITFWITYSFGTTAFLFQIAVTYISITNEEKSSKKILGLPMLIYGFVYLLFTLLFSFVMFIVNSFKSVPWWISLVVFSVLLISNLILITASFYVKGSIQKLERKESLETSFISELLLDVKTLASEDINIDLKIRKLVNAVQNSDPVSSKTVMDLEQLISDKLIEIKDSLSKTNHSSVIKTIDEFIGLIDERNYRCKASKKSDY